MDGWEEGCWVVAVHGSSVTASITITILDSYTFTWKRLIITLQQILEHASCSQIIVASLLMLKVQMHFAFEVDNFHTVDCAVIYNLPSVIIQFTRGRVPVRVITLPRQSSVSAAHLTPPGLASSAVLLAVCDRPCLWSLHPPSPPPARHWHLQVTYYNTFTFNSQAGLDNVRFQIDGGHETNNFQHQIKYWISCSHAYIGSKCQNFNLIFPYVAIT